MPVTVKPYWERALHRFRLALVDDGGPERLRETSRERIIRYREQMEATAASSRDGSAPFRGPAALRQGEDVGPPMKYRAMMLDEHGRIVCWQSVKAAGDDEAAVLAAGLVDPHAVDLWDGLRFIEHFAASRP